MRRRLLLVVLAAALVAAAIAWATRGGGGHAPPIGEFVVAERGDVALTVGGIGHVTTLTGAALLTLPSATPATAGGSASAQGGPPAPAGGQSTADIVFPAVAGHVVRLLVQRGDRVVAGQPVALLDDDGTIAGAVLQARGDASAARLELAQRRIQDPARGTPPLAPELTAGRDAVRAARARLDRIAGPPLAADVAAARLDVAKARADVRLARAGTADALSAAQFAALSAERRLQTLNGTPDPSDVAAAQLEVAKAVLDQETLLRRQPAPSAAAVSAADLSIALAQQHIADATASGSAADLAAARAELAKAQSEREALLAPQQQPTEAARAAAALAVEVAQRRLAGLAHPAAAVVGAARAELAKARADVAATRAGRGMLSMRAAAAVLGAARSKLAAVRRGPTADIVAAARSDVQKSRSDLATLRQRGAPASATDLALARLKLDVAIGRVALASRQTSRLTVRANATGTVTSILTTPGANADPTTPVLRVQDLGHLVVALDLSEFDVGRTRVGAPALISVDALGGREFGAAVVDIAAGGIDNGGVVNFPVMIRLRTRHEQLRPGMSVSARIIVRRRRDVVRIPLGAVSGDGHQAEVTLRRGDGQLLRRRIVLGLAGKEFAEVRSGLRPGDRVLIPAGG